MHRRVSSRWLRWLVRWLVLLQAVQAVGAGAMPCCGAQGRVAPVGSAPVAMHDAAAAPAANPPCHEPAMLDGPDATVQQRRAANALAVQAAQDVQATQDAQDATPHAQAGHADAGCTDCADCTLCAGCHTTPALHAEPASSSPAALNRVARLRSEPLPFGLPFGGPERPPKRRA